MRKRAITTLVILVASISMAVAESTWHTDVKIKKVYPLASGDFVLILNKDSAKCTGVESPNYYRVAVGENRVTAEGANKIYSAALSAAMANKSVNINFDDSTPHCYINRLQVVF
nr:hypothetical protein 18 [Saccharospirillaceae bacterium]